MAKVVQGKIEQRAGRPYSYPWDEWVEQTKANDTFVKAVQGEDFTVSVQSFQNMVHQAARAKGLKAQTSVDGETVEFRFFEGSTN